MAETAIPTTAPLPPGALDSIPVSRPRPTPLDLLGDGSFNFNLAANSIANSMFTTPQGGNCMGGDHIQSIFQTATSMLQQQGQHISVNDLNANFGGDRTQQQKTNVGDGNTNPSNELLRTTTMNSNASSFWPEASLFLTPSASSVGCLSNLSNHTTPMLVDATTTRNLASQQMEVTQRLDRAMSCDSTMSQAVSCLSNFDNLGRNNTNNMSLSVMSLSSMNNSGAPPSMNNSGAPMLNNGASGISSCGGHMMQPGDMNMIANSLSNCNGNNFQQQGGFQHQMGGMINNCDTGMMMGSSCQMMNMPTAGGSSCSSSSNNCDSSTNFVQAQNVMGACNGGPGGAASMTMQDVPQSQSQFVTQQQSHFCHQHQNNFSQPQNNFSQQSTNVVSCSEQMHGGTGNTYQQVHQQPNGCNAQGGMVNTSMGDGAFQFGVGPGGGGATSSTNPNMMLNSNNTLGGPVFLTEAFQANAGSSACGTNTSGMGRIPGDDNMLNNFSLVFGSSSEKFQQEEKNSGGDCRGQPFGKASHHTENGRQNGCSGNATFTEQELCSGNSTSTARPFSAAPNRAAPSPQLRGEDCRGRIGASRSDEQLNGCAPSGGGGSSASSSSDRAGGGAKNNARSGKAGALSTIANNLGGLNFNVPPAPVVMPNMTNMQNRPSPPAPPRPRSDDRASLSQEQRNNHLAVPEGGSYNGGVGFPPRAGWRNGKGAATRPGGGYHPPNRVSLQSKNAGGNINYNSQEIFGSQGRATKGGSSGSYSLDNGVDGVCKDHKGSHHGFQETPGPQPGERYNGPSSGAQNYHQPSSGSRGSPAVSSYGNYSGSGSAACGPGGRRDAMSTFSGGGGGGGGPTTSSHFAPATHFAQSHSHAANTGACTWGASAAPSVGGFTGSGKGSASASSSSWNRSKPGFYNWPPGGPAASGHNHPTGGGKETNANGYQPREATEKACHVTQTALAMLEDAFKSQERDREAAASQIAYCARTEPDSLRFCIHRCTEKIQHGESVLPEGRPREGAKPEKGAALSYAQAVANADSIIQAIQPIFLDLASCDSGKVSVLLRCWLDLIILQERVEPLQQILRDLVPRLPDLGRQEKAARTVQKVVEAIGERCTTWPQLLEGLRACLDAMPPLTTANPRREHTTAHLLITDEHGHHILQRIVKLYMEKELRGGEYLVDYVQGRVAEFACDRQGCCFLQRVHPLASDAQRQWIREALLADLPAIAQHCYGNYVVQNLIERADDEQWKADVVERMIDFGVRDLCCQKHSSNVLEKCLEHGHDHAAPVRRLVQELLRDPAAFEVIFRDKFGNYVLQRALAVMCDKSQSLDLFHAMLRILMPMLLRNTTIVPHAGPRYSAVDGGVDSITPPLPSHLKSVSMKILTRYRLNFLEVAQNDGAASIGDTILRLTESSAAAAAADTAAARCNKAAPPMVAPWGEVAPAASSVGTATVGSIDKGSSSAAPGRSTTKGTSKAVAGAPTGTKGGSFMSASIGSGCAGKGGGKGSFNMAESLSNSSCGNSASSSCWGRIPGGYNAPPGGGTGAAAGRGKPLGGGRGGGAGARQNQFLQYKPGGAADMFRSAAAAVETAGEQEDDEEEQQQEESQEWGNETKMGGGIPCAEEAFIKILSTQPPTLTWPHLIE
eukprot:CAMPEP_0179009510 /NCGR_PEP_ID=MMETSP0795-20121207/16310_1 /TAXON_ID=88552 /ORGANISM="Amoebophrya sp., Strain Ameob2" /LENGTH=1630 /DNA_ID=CAMNT_0020704711 /DNA_START=452 /DNA_END=5343 /DNA_ORIENTATION=-